MLLSEVVAQQEQAGGASVWTFVLPFVLLGVLWFVMIRPQRRRQREMAEMQRNVQPGQRVMTGSGLIGTVSDVQDEEVVLEIAPGVEARFVKQAVARNLDPTTSDDGAESDEETAGTEGAKDGESAALPVTHDDGRKNDS